jgi:hypothetical protein
MMTMMRRSLASLAAALPVAMMVQLVAAQQQRPAAPQHPPENRRNFVSCPIVRDTNTVPCFLAEMNGELYFLGVQEDTSSLWYPPQLGHKVLVEGTVAPGPLVCGGIPLKPVVTSVIPELDPSCNTLLPAEEGIEAPPVHRGPGPSTERAAAARVAPPSAAAPAATAAPSHEPREFTLLFDFDNDFMSRFKTPIVAEAVRYAKAIGASARVELTSYRGATLLSNGETLVEAATTAPRRATKLQQILVGLGIPAASLTIKSMTEPETPNGVADEHSRRVVIRVAP